MKGAMIFTALDALAIQRRSAKVVFAPRLFAPSSYCLVSIGSSTRGTASTDGGRGPLLGPLWRHYTYIE